MENETVNEIIRFVEPVDFNVELQNAAIKAVAVAVIGTATSILMMRLVRCKVWINVRLQPLPVYRICVVRLWAVSACKSRLTF